MSFLEKTKKLLKEKLDALNQLDIGWLNRPYDFYLLFGQNEESTFPWIKSNWDKDFEPCIDLLLKQTENRGKTGIKATKYKAERRIAKKDGKAFIYHSEIKLGRLTWDVQSHEKWTLFKANESYFQSFELWAPIWTVCEKRDSPPDIFISIANENDFENKRAIQFGYFMVLAVAKNLAMDSKPIIKELSERIHSKITIGQIRKWGNPKTSGNWTFNNWIQDTFSNGIYKGKSVQLINFHEEEFEPFWEIIYRE